MSHSPWFRRDFALSLLSLPVVPGRHGLPDCPEVDCNRAKTHDDDSRRRSRGSTVLNFDFTEREEAFRKEVRRWLEANLPDDLRGRAFASSRAGLDEVRRLRAWQKTMHAAGYVGMDWPREFGGRGASITEMVILYQEMARAESPQLVNRGGVSMLGPTLMKHRTPAPHRRLLPETLTTPGLWCPSCSAP